MDSKPLNILFFKLALYLNNKFADILIQNQVHFRGNLNSISLISLSDEKPELGVKCYPQKEWTESRIQNYINEIKAIQKPRRPTPEKSLQAWIIRKSIENKYFLTFDKSIRFITSELAIYDYLKGKIVSDILGFDIEKNRLVIIELKSKREQSRLIKQVNNFEEIINTYLTFFRELIELHGYQIKNDPLKAIVWPKAKTISLSIMKERNIIEYEYEELYNNFIITKA